MSISSRLNVAVSIFEPAKKRENDYAFNYTSKYTLESRVQNLQYLQASAASCYSTIAVRKQTLPCGVKHSEESKNERVRKRNNAQI